MTYPYGRYKYLNAAGKSGLPLTVAAYEIRSGSKTARRPA